MRGLSVQTLTGLGVSAFFVISQASADDLAETAGKIQAAYTSAQLEWHRGLAELVIEKRPDFEAVATAQRNLQAAYLELRTARFERLLAENPSRIVLTRGLPGFTNFIWSDEDTQTLREADPSYAALEAEVAALRKRSDDQPDWPSFREYFRDTLVKSKEQRRRFSRQANRRLSPNRYLRDTYGCQVGIVSRCRAMGRLLHVT